MEPKKVNETKSKTDKKLRWCQQPQMLVLTNEF